MNEKFDLAVESSLWKYMLVFILKSNAESLNSLNLISISQKFINHAKVDRCWVIDACRYETFWIQLGQILLKIRLWSRWNITWSTIIELIPKNV